MNSLGLSFLAVAVGEFALPGCCSKKEENLYFIYRELAQLVERHPYKVDVAGSTPVLPTNLLVLRLFSLNCR